MKPTSILKKKTIQIPTFAITLVTAMLVWLSIPSAAFTQTETQDKAITIRSSGGPLDIRFRAVKPVFTVGEAIRFKVQGNQAFYLYLFSINKEQNRAVLLTPGDTNASLQYPAGRKYRIPGGGIEFFADRPGLEEVVMVATTKPIPIDRMGFGKSGAFLSTTADGADDEVKSICTRTTRRQGHFVVKKLTLIIQ